VVVLVVAIFVGDQIALARTRSTIESHIEKSVPGSHATVSISSSPYLVRLALSGTVKEIHAHVTNVKEGGFTLDTVDVTVHNLKISRSDLLHGSVHLQGMSSATITASTSVTQLLTQAGYAAIAGFGSLASGLNGKISAGANDVTITFGPVSFSLPYSAIVPCVGSARVTGGDVVFSCTTTTLPPALQSG
jgi:LmeA-like phospholipid-binding